MTRTIGKISAADGVRPTTRKNLGIIYDVHHAVTEALNESGYPLLVKYDIWGEGAQASTSNVQAQYIGQLWNDYNAQFGKNDTPGVSFVSTYGTTDVGDKVTSTLQIYDSTAYGRPYYYDIHVYEWGSTNLNIFNNALTAGGVDMGTGMVIGEAYYNNYDEAADVWTYISNYSNARNIFFLLQWPLTRGSGAQNVDVAPPSAFDAYVNWGS
jgi:hypothetical protein